MIVALLLACSLLTASGLIRPVAAAATRGERQLEGTWLVVEMARGDKPVGTTADVSMTMRFRTADHSWLFTVETKERSFSEAGRWRLNGSRLITTTEDGRKIERMRVRSIGKDVLELKKTDERLVLKRQAK